MVRVMILNEHETLYSGPAQSARSQAAAHSWHCDAISFCLLPSFLFFSFLPLGWSDSLLLLLFLLLVVAAISLNSFFLLLIQAKPHWRCCHDLFFSISD